MPARPSVLPKRRNLGLAADALQPSPTINTTPLIDVMLVLLIMFIITIPVASHKVPLDLPRPSPDPRLPAPIHRLGIDPVGQLFWDGSAISGAQLPARLRAMAVDPADPDLHLVASAEARYERVDQVLAEVKRAGVTRIGFVGNEQFAVALNPG